jgi:GNAT superfamily N-acetyltransferase
VLGYVLSHPWRSGEGPALNTLLVRIPDAPTTHYVHDLALLPEARGQGAAAPEIARLAAAARASGIPEMSLTALPGTVPFWTRQGFRQTAKPVPAGAGYGGGARHMIRHLTGPVP